MKTQELVSLLKKAYEAAPKGEQVASIYVFGIRHADDLSGHSLHDIAEAATGKRSYGAELNKARNLAPYVTIRENPHR